LTDPSTLETFAQLSIGLIGFAGVVSALGKSRLHIETRSFRIKALLLYSVTALLGSVLPMVLLSFELGPLKVWLISGTVFALVCIGIVMWGAVALRRLAIAGHIPAVLAVGLWGIGALVVLLLIYALVFATPSLQSIYLVGLFWALGMGVFHFCMLVVSIQLQDEGT
jgi:hypothetical protein